MYSIPWDGRKVKLNQRICFMYKGNQLFGIVSGYNAKFTNLLVTVDALSF